MGPELCILSFELTNREAPVVITIVIALNLLVLIFVGNCCLLLIGVIFGENCETQILF